jgi:hypothetical protein
MLTLESINDKIQPLKSTIDELLNLGISLEQIPKDLYRMTDFSNEIIHLIKHNIYLFEKTCNYFYERTNLLSSLDLSYNDVINRLKYEISIVQLDVVELNSINYELDYIMAKNLEEIFNNMNSRDPFVISYGFGSYIQIIFDWLYYEDFFHAIYSKKAISTNSIVIPFNHYYYQFKNIYLNQDSILTHSENEQHISYDNLEYNKKIIERVMEDVVKNLPYKKIICWCQTIQSAILWRKWFGEKFTEYSLFLSTKYDRMDDPDYIKFKSMKPSDILSEVKSILFCIGKIDEDISFLDCGIYLDVQGSCFQTAGCGITRYKFITIVEGYTTTYNTVAKLIIAYYEKLLEESVENYGEHSFYLLERTTYDQINNTIKLSLDNIIEHDYTINIDIPITNWNKVLDVLTSYVKNKTEIVKTDCPNMKLIKKNIFVFSKIKNVVINGKTIRINRYRKLLEYVYNLIKDVDILRNYSLDQLFRGNTHDSNNVYLEHLDLSFRNHNAKDTIMEIVNQLTCSNISFDIKIELHDKSILNLVKI